MCWGCQRDNPGNICQSAALWRLPSQRPKALTFILFAHTNTPRRCWAESGGRNCGRGFGEEPSEPASGAPLRPKARPAPGHMSSTPEPEPWCSQKKCFLPISPSSRCRGSFRTNPEEGTSGRILWVWNLFFTAVNAGGAAHSRHFLLLFYSFCEHNSPSAREGSCSFVLFLEREEDLTG